MMKSESNLKIFFIKLVSITFAVIVIINVFYNIFLADKLDILNKLSNLDKGTANIVKDKIRSEIKSGLEKDRILSKEDAILIKRFIDKISLELKIEINLKKYLTLLSKQENNIKILLILYSLYCSYKIGMSWDEGYYQKIGEINQNIYCHLVKLTNHFL